MGASRLFAAAMLCMSSCQRPAPPEPVVAEAALPSPSYETLWTSASPSGRAFLEQRRGEGCSLVCVTESGKEAWQLAECLAEKDDLRFVGDDCETALILYPLPTRDSSWAKAPLLRLLRGGVVTSTLRGSDIPGLDLSATRFRWLGGVLGEIGAPPHYSADGSAVEFELRTQAGRRMERIPLKQTVAPVAQAGVAMEPLTGDDSTLYTWTDENGDLQVAQGLSQVPAQFRKRARPVVGEVGVIEGVKRTPPAKKAEVQQPEELYGLRAMMQAGRKGSPQEPIDTCADARAELQKAESKFASAGYVRQAPDCRAVLAASGREAFARCMTVGPTTFRDPRAVERAKLEVESARETLRRAQVSGCR